MVGEQGQQDYLRVIYELEDGKGAKSVEIAKKLKISKASVSEMLRKLAVKKLVIIKPYSKVYLTRKGKIEAENMFAKYFAIKTFIKKFLKYEDDKAREEAHKLEHFFSQESVDMLNKLTEETSELKSIPRYVG